MLNTRLETGGVGMRNESELEAFIRSHGEELLRLAFTYVKHHQVAEDVVQEVLLTAFEKQAEFRQESSYRTYLYRLTINRCIDYLRSWHHKNIIVSETFRSLTSQLTKSTTETLADSKTLGDQILQLPLKYREVLVFYYYKELSIKEIAEVLQISENTIKTRLQRARLRLKDKLEGSGYDAKSFYQKEY